MDNQSRSLTLLIVDDNKVNQRILGATFEDGGFNIHLASSVEEAQVKLREHLDDVDLVLSDIQMPGLSGFDLVKWMKSEASAIKDIPILLITSQMPETENRILGLSLGAVDYFERSLDPQELVLRATHAIEHYNHIKSLKRSLETTENLVSTGRLFAASNHEIKNVAQFIWLATGIMERELETIDQPVSETYQQAFKMLQRSSSLLSDMTKMISGLVSHTDADMGPVDVCSLLEQVFVMVKPMLKGRIDLSSQTSGSMSIFGNPTYLKQILINLILNARDAIDEAKSQNPGKIVIKADLREDHIALSVVDNGVGFPEEETRCAFQPFASTKQLRGGTGLGLWFSAQLVQKMQGTLTLSSKGLGRGAEANIMLKRARP